MLTDRKRKKLLAGVLAAVMLTSTAGCGTDDKDSEAQGDAAAQEEKKDGNGGFFHGFFPWYFIGRTFGVGPMAGVRQAAPAQPNQNNQQQTAAGSAGAAANWSSTGDGKNSGSTVQQGSTSTTQKSTLGSTGSSGKSGIGSGLSRSSGSAIS